MVVFAVVFYLVLLCGMGLMAWTIDRLYRQNGDLREQVGDCERAVSRYRAEAEECRQRAGAMQADRDRFHGLADHHCQMADAHKLRHRELLGRLDHITKIATGELTLDDSANP